MKRVLHVMASLERSGMEQMLLSSATAWNEAGYTCDVVATAATEGPQADALRRSGFGVYHLPFRGRFRLLPRMAFIRDFTRLCASGYDIVHIQVEAGRPLFALLARLAGVKTLAVTPHNAFRYRGGLRLRKMAERHLIQALGGRYGMISQGVQECEWETFRICGKRIWNWIDTQYYRPPSGQERAEARAVLGVGDGQFLVVSMANCNAAKNHKALFEALALIPSAERPVYIHVGREETGQSERLLAEQLAVADITQFHGSQPDSRPYFWAADAVAMPSLHEGLAISALEAVACGAPLICSDVAGLREIAEQAAASVLVAPSPRSIAQGLRAAMDAAKESRQAQALQDSSRIREQFSVSHGVDSIIRELYCA